MPDPPKPSQVLITSYLIRWSQLENYRLQEDSLCLLFNTLCSDNKSIEHILLKVSALNDFYSTNIFDTYSVAKHILNANVDLRLESKDYSLVNDIARISIKGKVRTFYSFASKYCSHHKPEIFPIYDAFVEKMLLHYQSVSSFDEFKKDDLKNYERFIEIIETFQVFYDLRKFSLREIDVFLWLVGRDYFPHNYKRGTAKRSTTNGNRPRL
jgi:hypothetical protein